MTNSFAKEKQKTSGTEDYFKILKKYKDVKPLSKAMVKASEEWSLLKRKQKS